VEAVDRLDNIFNHLACDWTVNERLPDMTLSPIQEIIRVWFMVFNATFNNISATAWWSVLLVKETGVPGENH
jgi:hypothetical protein